MVEYITKVISIGDFQVGKTAIARKFSTGQFDSSYLITIGVDFMTKQVELDNGVEVKVQIWDTGGQENFSRILPFYYLGALGTILVFDLTRPRTLERTRGWLNEVKTHNPLKFATVLVGNKNDMEFERKISTEEALLFKEELEKEFKMDIIYMETSAKTGYNIQELFKTLVTEIVRRIETGELNVT